MEAKRISLDVVKGRYFPEWLITYNQDMGFALFLKKVLYH